MNPLRLTYLDRYRAEQRGYVERGLSASYAYAERVLTAIADDLLSDDAIAAVGGLRSAMSNHEPIADHLSALFVAVPAAFKPEFVGAK